jgi:hypothetical protein
VLASDVVCGPQRVAAEPCADVPPAVTRGSSTPAGSDVRTLFLGWNAIGSDLHNMRVILSQPGIDVQSVCF